MLLVGAGLMVRSFASLLATDPGFRPEGALAFHVNLPNTRYASPTERDAVVRRVLQRLRALPDVTMAGASTSMPPNRMQMSTGFTVEGEAPAQPGRGPTAIYVPATPHFLSSIGAPILSGRDFTDADGAAAPNVAIISRDLARHHFANREPIGRTIEIDGATRTIVGVTSDVTYEGIGKPGGRVVYVPFAQSTFGGVWLAVRSNAQSSTLVDPIRTALHDIDPQMNARDVAPMESLVSDSVVRPRFQAWLLGTFGALALMLAAIGIYGVIAYGVAQRTSEIGLRLALGAPPQSVIRLILARGMTPVILGLAVGLAGAFALSRVMAGLLYGVSPTDSWTFAATTVLLGGIALVAAFVPAARAARLDPLGALRQG
jgi:putative ABC transport system permease protein